MCILLNIQIKNHEQMGIIFKFYLIIKRDFVGKMPLDALLFGDQPNSQLYFHPIDVLFQFSAIINSLNTLL